MELLADALAAVVRTPLATALGREVIVVASQGFERWLAQELARRLGIWSNARFPFPRTFIDELLRADDDASAVGATDDRAVVAWAVARLLPEIAKRPGAEAIAAYLANDERGSKRFDLAQKVAYCFDQYAVYRPELCAAWASGAGRGWQPDLFRAVTAELGAMHLGARVEQFLSRPIPAAVPERVSVFGVSALPPIYVRVLARLAQYRELHLFTLSPSRASEDDLHPLVASLGSAGLEFERLLGGTEGVRISDYFAEPAAKTMLDVLKSDLLEGKKRSADAGVARATIRPGDGSIAVHSCHSALREVEVLRDQLLDRFESDPSLEPHQVIVMTPDIDTYAPLVDAVFGVDPSATGFIPHRIFDRKPSGFNTVAEALFRLLDLAGSRMKASAVLDLFELEPVRRKFGIDAEDLPDLRALLSAAKIRWGFDAEHRATFGQPRSEENTWRFGLRRLLLGQAMGQDLFAGVLPVETSSDLGALVGNLSSAIRALAAWNDALAFPRSMADFARELPTRLADFVSMDEPHGADFRVVVTAIQDVANNAKRGGFVDTIHREVLAELLTTELDRDGSARNFLGGGVTVSALLPMRSIPFRVVYLLGMSDTNFPRREHAPGFDLVAHHPLAGDRSTRAEDRLLFLEALLSARDQLVVSYVGRAVSDNAPYPPSVVVSELLDTLDATFTTSREAAHQLPFSFDHVRVASDGVGRRSVLEHPLQPFSKRYFGADPDPRLFSYGDAEAAGARALSTSERRRRRFHSKPLSCDAAESTTIDELARFFENPARALLERRLGLSFWDDAVLLSDREPLEISPLDAYELGSALVARVASGAPPDALVEWARAMGLVPYGTPGEVDLDDVLADVQAFAAVVRRFLREEPQSAAVDIALDGGKLVGTIGGLYAEGRVALRFARLKPKNEVSSWVRHLAMQFLPEGQAKTTIVGGRATQNVNGRVELRFFEPLALVDARTHLSALMRLYRLGQQAPLCFFPGASKVFAERWKKDAEKPQAGPTPLERARGAFSDSRLLYSEGDDPYVKRLFDGVDPFAESPVPFDEDGALGLPSFGEIARAIYIPMLDASRVEAA